MFRFSLVDFETDVLGSIVNDDAIADQCINVRLGAGDEVIGVQQRLAMTRNRHLGLDEWRLGPLSLAQGPHGSFQSFRDLVAFGPMHLIELIATQQALMAQHQIETNEHRAVVLPPVAALGSASLRSSPLRGLVRVSSLVP